MKTHVTIIAGLLVITNALFAQQQPAPAKFAFRSIAQFSMINGNDAVSAGIQSVNGATFKGWFAGVGIGLDFYRYRSVPIFLDLRKEFAVKKNKIFIYADGGYNLPWVKKNNVSRDWPGWGNYKEDYVYKGGKYFDAGLGYAIGFAKGGAFLLSAGYSHKAFDETKTTSNTSGVGTPQETTFTDVQKFSYRFNRLMLKVGWQF